MIAGGLVDLLIVAHSLIDGVPWHFKTVHHAVVFFLLKPMEQKFFVVCISISIGNQPSGGQVWQTINITKVMVVYLKVIKSPPGGSLNTCINS